jgi:hypothetical protein
MVYADGAPLTAAEAAGDFTWLGIDDGRNALLCSTVSGREGMLARNLLRRG